MAKIKLSEKQIENIEKIGDFIQRETVKTTGDIPIGKECAVKSETYRFPKAPHLRYRRTYARAHKTLYIPTGSDVYDLEGNFIYHKSLSKTLFRAVHGG